MRVARGDLDRRGDAAGCRRARPRTSNRLTVPLRTLDTNTWPRFPASWTVRSHGPFRRFGSASVATRLPLRSRTSTDPWPAVAEVPSVLGTVPTSTNPDFRTARRGVQTRRPREEDRGLAAGGRPHDRGARPLEVRAVVEVGDQDVARLQHPVPREPGGDERDAVRVHVAIGGDRAHRPTGRVGDLGDRRDVRDPEARKSPRPWATRSRCSTAPAIPDRQESADWPGCGLSAYEESWRVNLRSVSKPIEERGKPASSIKR